MKNQRNYSMDIWRFCAALCVIVCHVDFMKEASAEVYQFVARYLPRVSLPFFFTISGYYYINALLAGKNVFKKQVLSLLKVYACWSVIYYAASFFMNIVVEKGDLKTFLIQRVVFFFLHGSYSHFWYFTAMIYTIIIVTCLYKLFGKKGLKVLTILSVFFFILANLGSAYYPIGMKIPFVCDLVSNRAVYEVIRGIFFMSLPYFLIGYILIELSESIEKLSSKALGIMLGIDIIVYLIECYVLACVLKWWDYPEVILTLYPSTILIMILLIRNPKAEWKPYAPTLKRLSGYMYYVHPLCIMILGAVEQVFSVTIPSVLAYILIVGFTISSGMILMSMSRKQKWINNFI